MKPLPSANLGHDEMDRRYALEVLLAAIQFELICPGTFDFKRAESLVKLALQQKDQA